MIACSEVAAYVWGIGSGLLIAVVFVVGVVIHYTPKWPRR